MQIHELDNYAGSMGDAYLAVDNGTDTGKVSTANLLNDTTMQIAQLESDLNNRIDNIIAGGDAPSAAEVTDGRHGASELGGSNFASLGDAIRSQANDLARDIGTFAEEEYSGIPRTAATTADNWKIETTTGYAVGDGDYRLVKYEVIPGDLLKIVSDYNCQFQNSASVPSGGALNRIGPTYGAGTFYLTVPTGVSHLILSTTKTGSLAAVYNLNPTVTEKTIEVYKDTNDIKGLHRWTTGRLSNQGTIAYSLSRIVSEIRQAETDLIVSLDDYDNYQMANAIYTDENYSSPSFSWWLAEPQVIRRGSWYCLSVAPKPDNGVAITDVYNSTSYNAIHITPISLENREAVLKSAIDSSYAMAGILETSRNIWDSSKDHPGWRWSGGLRLTKNASYYVTDDIPVEPSTEYVASANGLQMAGVKLYGLDENHSYLRQVPATNGVFTTDADVHFIVMETTEPNYINAEQKQLEKGSAATKYVPYYLVNSDNVSGTDIVPYYYESALTTAITDIRNALNDAGRNKSAFCFFTDPHWGKNSKHSPALIKRLIEKTPLQNVICGGDVITDHDTKANSLAELYDFQDAFKYLGDRFYNCIGNHDTNNNAGDQPAEELTDNEIYSTLYSQSESPYIVWGDYYTYYFDNQAERTRYLFTDTGWFKKWTPERIDFMAQALNSLAAGWHCVVITHVVYATRLDVAPPAFVKVLLDMLDNYNDRAAHTISYSDYNESVTEDDEPIPYDFTNAKGSVKLVVAGHTHVDQVYTTAGGIKCIMFDCDAQVTSSGNPSTVGTINEQCITVIVADYDAAVCNCIRLGRGSSATYPLISE